MLRLIVYLLAGGLLMALIDPPEGFMQTALLVVVILLMALVDSRLGQAKGVAGHFYDMNQLYQTRQKQKAQPKQAAKEKRSLALVFSSSLQPTAQQLVDALRAKGLHPVLVTSRREGAGGLVLFEVLLPEKEERQARSLVDRFQRNRPGGPTLN